MTTWVCIASGPSLTPGDVDFVRGKASVAVVNDGYRLAPWADALYACDQPWWELHVESVRASFNGRCYSHSQPVAERYDLIHVPGTDGEGLCREPMRVHYGANGGYQIVNLVYHFGATRILLLGYDMKPDPADPARTHWFGQHPGNLERGRPDKYAKWVERFRRMAADLKAEGVEVINCSRETALPWFERQSIEEAL